MKQYFCSGSLVVPPLNCIRYDETPLKMAAVTTHRKFLNVPKQFHLKPETACQFYIISTFLLLM